MSAGHKKTNFIMHNTFGSFKHLLNASLAMLILINPISKIFIISTFPEQKDKKELTRVLVHSTLIAMCILLLFALTGNTLLQKVFHVQIYAFMIAGGIVLMFRGFTALNKGLFFETDVNSRLEDISIVPLASPMIAGPATIAASVSFPASYSLKITLAGIIVALFINLGVMLVARSIGNVLKKFNLMGALIRITGLIVSTIGIQMILNGFIEFVKQTGF